MGVVMRLRGVIDARAKCCPRLREASGFAPKERGMWNQRNSIRRCYRRRGSGRFVANRDLDRPEPILQRGMVSNEYQKVTCGHRPTRRQSVRETATAPRARSVAAQLHRRKQVAFAATLECSPLHAPPLDATGRLDVEDDQPFRLHLRRATSRCPHSRASGERAKPSRVSPVSPNARGIRTFRPPARSQPYPWRTLRDIFSNFIRRNVL
jgi:hypothetical protein